MTSIPSDSSSPLIELRQRRARIAAPDKPLDNGSTNITTHNEPLIKVKAGKSFVFSNTVWSYNWSILETTSGSRQPVYHATVCPVNWNKPDIVLRAGHDHSGNIVAVAHFRFCRNVHMGFGNPEVNNADNMTWERMNSGTLCTFIKSSHEFELVRGSDGEEREIQNTTFIQGPRHKYAWKRTFDGADGVKGWSGRLSLRNFKLIDCDTGQTIAVFLAKNLKSLVEAGDLIFYEDVPKRLEVATIMTIGSIIEKFRRRE